MEVIAISGKKGTGKDWYASQLLHENPAYTALVAFADPLKQRLYGEGHEDVLLADKPIDTRQLLIETGTAEREKFGTRFYAHQMMALIKLYQMRGMRTVIITDLRLKAELGVLQAFASDGLFSLSLIRMEAPKRNQARIEREAKGDMERAARLAADESEVDLDEVATAENGWTVVCNDPPEPTE